MSSPRTSHMVGMQGLLPGEGEPAQDNHRGPCPSPQSAEDDPRQAGSRLPGSVDGLRECCGRPQRLNGHHQEAGSHLLVVTKLWWGPSTHHPGDQGGGNPPPWGCSDNCLCPGCMFGVTSAVLPVAWWQYWCPSASHWMATAGNAHPPPVVCTQTPTLSMLVRGKGEQCRNMGTFC